MTKTETFSDDKLDRKVVAENFNNILLNTHLNVFSLVAPQGGGKTYFIQNLIRTMEEDSINILYNAYEVDEIITFSNYFKLFILHYSLFSFFIFLL